MLDPLQDAVFGKGDYMVYGKAEDFFLFYFLFFSFFLVFFFSLSCHR